MHTIDCCSVFVNYIVIEGANQNTSIEAIRQLRQVFANKFALNRSLDFSIRGTRFLVFPSWVANSFGVERVDVTGSSAQPDKNAGVRLLADGDNILTGPGKSATRSCHGGQGPGTDIAAKFSAIHVSTSFYLTRMNSGELIKAQTRSSIRSRQSGCSCWVAKSPRLTASSIRSLIWVASG